MSTQATAPVKWDDPELTPQVAWAMGVEAASEEYDAWPTPANGKCVDHEAKYGDWFRWKGKRKDAGAALTLLTVPKDFALEQHFHNGWQAQRSELLAEHVAKIVHDAMAYYCIDDGKIEDITEWFTERLDLDGWFAGAGE